MNILKAIRLFPSIVKLAVLIAKQEPLPIALVDKCEAQNLVSKWDYVPSIHGNFYLKKQDGITV